MTLDLCITNREGEPIDSATIATERFGNAFFLPLDCPIGWFGMRGTKLRLFNRISNTIVICVESDEFSGVEYSIPAG